MTNPTVKLCSCGAKPEGRSSQFAEDAVDAWIECPGCGAKTEAVEDAYADWGSAAYLWNRGDRA